MANASRWSLSARQGIPIGALITAGLFVVCCGTGMGNIPVAALGIALGVLGPVVIVLSNARANRADVFGTAHVSQSSPPPATGLTGRADLHLLVNAQGVHNAVVRLRDPAVPVSRWPDIGATLPVLIPNGNPRRLQVLWDQVRGHHDVSVMHGPSYSAYSGQEYLHDEEFGEYESDAYDDEVPGEEEPDQDQDHDLPVPVTAGVGSTSTAEVTAPARSRPSPRPRRRREADASPAEAEPADSVEAVVPMPAVTPPGAIVEPPPPVPTDHREPGLAGLVAPVPAEQPEPGAPEQPTTMTEADAIEADALESRASGPHTAEPEAAEPEAAEATEADVVETDPDHVKADADPGEAHTTGTWQPERQADESTTSASAPVVVPAQPTAAEVSLAEAMADQAPPRPAETSPADAATDTHAVDTGTLDPDARDTGARDTDARDTVAAATGEPSEATASEATASEAPPAETPPAEAPPADAAAHQVSAPLPSAVPNPPEPAAVEQTGVVPEPAAPVASTDDGRGAAQTVWQRPPTDPHPAPVTPVRSPEPDPPHLAAYFADQPDDSPPGLSGVHNVSVTLIVADLRRSLTFYRDLLGLTEIDSGVGSAVLASGNARILLRQVTDTRPVDRRVVHLNLEVDDVHEAYDRLRREGVEFMHPPRVVNQGEQLELWAATFRDPDGHAIALTRWEIRR